MKLDATDLRYITSDEFRVLTAVIIHRPRKLGAQYSWPLSGRDGVKEPRSRATISHRSNFWAAKWRGQQTCWISRQKEPDLESTKRQM